MSLFVKKVYICMLSENMAKREVQKNVRGKFVQRKDDAVRKAKKTIPFEVYEMQTYDFCFFSF